jgi:hypothetical protein
LLSKDPLQYVDGLGQYQYEGSQPNQRLDPAGTWSTSKLAPPKGCSGANIVWGGSYSLHTNGIFMGRVYSDFGFTGNDDCGCVYQVQGYGFGNVKDLNANGIFAGWINDTFTLDANTSAPLWPISQGDEIWAVNSTWNLWILGGGSMLGGAGLFSNWAVGTPGGVNISALEFNLHSHVYNINYNTAVPPGGPCCTAKGPIKGPPKPPVPTPPVMPPPSRPPGLGEPGGPPVF